MSDGEGVLPKHDLKSHLLIHLQPGFPFLELQSSEQCQRAPSSAPERGMGTDESF